MPEADPTTRFSDRVADYVRYRPGYPDELALTLLRETGLGAGAAVADVGSGTGISAELFLRHGCEVHAVEPNAAMRAAAEARLGGEPRFHSVAGTAEATTLADRSVELVVAGQAFHWFRPAAARREFARVLRSPGHQVGLFWNTRRTDTPFLEAYEALLHEYATDYGQVDHRRIGPATLAPFFGGDYRTHHFPSGQALDHEALRGRLLSSSYTPPPGHPRHEPMLARLAGIFAEHQEDGVVHFLYDTELHLGALRGRRSARALTSGTRR